MFCLIVVVAPIALVYYPSIFCIFNIDGFIAVFPYGIITFRDILFIQKILKYL